MRYPEIDIARGVAVILMLVFHSFFDAYYFGKIELSGAFWYYFPRFIGGMFIFISGYTLSVINPDLSRLKKKVLKLAALAATITAVTFALVPDEVVVFGIIHFFTLATLIGYIFLRYPKIQLPAGLTFFVIGLIMNRVRVDTETLVWLGLMPYGFSTLDYYPLLPWLGVFLIGMFSGNVARPKGINLNVPLVPYLGRNSLKIYVVQHPVIIVALHLLYGDVIQQILGI
ncbi:MAG: DUF1624 domain-containing protein [Archaeoglobus sp.]|uniref:heparan-alpha-glucosaminide N-acetyltransferase n=1 Tax=Archaeoglobus sp. TaxID=1872626 RepID=UPI001D91D236|nr:heparan-alpha-glucosaminide N-acetyltransferase domain-containing protein [Archaeoglobus sp.]MBO8178907.1 DUF1624 domain-containing protein [Archaeoglobus sp.]